jgi:putative transposase
VHRDPYDLSRIYLHSQHADEIIELPAVEKWAEYANGLTAHQHKLCRQHELVREEQRSNPIALMKAKAAIIEAGRGALKSGVRKKLQRDLVRFLEGNKAPFLQAEIAQGSAHIVGYEPMPLSPVMPTPSLIAAEQSALVRQPEVKTALSSTLQSTLASVDDDMDEIERMAGEMASGVRGP